jgi:hypothetical protein
MFIYTWLNRQWDVHVLGREPTKKNLHETNDTVFTCSNVAAATVLIATITLFVIGLLGHLQVHDWLDTSCIQGFTFGCGAALALMIGIAIDQLCLRERSP